MRNHVFSTLFALAAAACSASSPSSPPADDGSSSAPADDTSRFAGTWRYQPGSTVVEDCAGEPEVMIDLSKVVGGQPAFFTMTASSGGVHEVDARGCQYDWNVSGDVATATAGQTCASFPDGHGGTLLVRLQSGAKTTSDGASMSVDVHFTTDAPSTCTIHVQGTTTKS